MDNPQDWPKLQAAADYLSVRRTVRVSAVVSLFFGAIATAVGALPPSMPVLAAFGVLLAAAALADLATAHPAALAVEGGALVVAGLSLFMITTAQAAADGGGRNVAHFALLGLFQTGWGAVGLARLPRLARAHAAHTSPDVLRRVSEAIEALRAASSARDERVVEFTTQDLHAHRHKLRLTPLGALCLLDDGREVAVVARRDISFQPVDRNAQGDEQRATARIGARFLDVRISREDLRRVQTWRRGHAIARRAAA